MVVKYQVERRPVGPDGTVYYGKEGGNGVAVLSNPSHQSLGGKTGVIPLSRTLASGQGAFPYYVPMSDPIIPPLTKTNNGEVFSQVVEQQGEPWLVYSQHHSLDAAIASAAPIAGAIGAGNVRIIKVLNHTTQFKLN